MSDPEELKRKLRKQMRTLRRGVARDVQSRASAEVCAQLAELLVDHDGVASFASIDNEVDLTALNDLVLQSGKRLYLPRVCGPGVMEFVRVGDLDELEPGAYDIPEPTGDELAAVGQFTLVLVPGVAFDRQGGRLGFGGGFYDRALAGLRDRVPQLAVVGVAYHWQVIDEPLPAEPWDVRVDQVVTDESS